MGGSAANRAAVAAFLAGAIVALGQVGASAAGGHHGRRLDFGRSVRGTTLRAVRLGAAGSVPAALVVGAIHGDEPAGEDVIRILRHRYRDLHGVALWTVKTVNPDGVAAGSRRNAHGVDLNRNFPYRWRDRVPPTSRYYPGPGPASEPETRAVMRLVRRIRPRVTIWYHQPWGQVLLPCRGRARIQRRYARLARWPVKRCRGARLPGTAIQWQNHRVGGTAFVVELGRRLSRGDARRHARAVAGIASALGPGASGRSAAIGRIARPRIDRDPIPYGKGRKREMAAYSARHYGRRQWRLRRPRVIVLHFTAGSTYRSAWNAFASNAPSLGELPGTCAHFVIGKSGAIHQLVPPRIRCRHTIGLNHVAIGIEMVQEQGPGSHWADRQILRRRPQVHAALRLVAWLQQRYGIETRNVIGHAMANHSPYFKDLEGWRNDHTDWLRRDVVVFRRRLRRLDDNGLEPSEGSISKRQQLR